MNTITIVYESENSGMNSYESENSGMNSYESENSGMNTIVYESANSGIRTSLSCTTQLFLGCIKYGIIISAFMGLAASLLVAICIDVAVTG